MTVAFSAQNHIAVLYIIVAILIAAIVAEFFSFRDDINHLEGAQKILFEQHYKDHPIGGATTDAGH